MTKPRGPAVAQGALVLSGEDPQPPFKPGDPLLHRRGKKNIASANCPKARRSAPPGCSGLKPTEEGPGGFYIV